MKYRNKKTVVDGITFDSKMESDYYLYLKELQKQGKIIQIVLQPEYVLLPSFKKFGRTVRKMVYRADFFVMYADRKTVVIDVKGVVTKDFRLKQKMFDYFYPSLELKLVTYYQSKWIELKDKPRKGRSNFGAGSSGRRKVPLPKK